MIRQLRIKFICINMAIVMLMLCAIFGFLMFFTQQNLEEDVVQMLESLVEEPFQLSRPNEYLSKLQLPYFSMLVGSRGELVATGGGYYDLPDKPHLMEILQAASSFAGHTGVLEEYDLRFCRSSTSSGEYYVFVDMANERATLAGLAKTGVLVGGLSCLAFFVISIFLARWAIKPVEKAWTQQRQFVADASHELKTPLTVIITNSELLQNPEYSEEERARFSNSILTMSRQMRGLVESLLALTRSDDGVAKLEFSYVNLTKAVSKSLLPFEPVYYENGLGLVSDLAADIYVKGSEPHLCQVLSVLLDNAAKYSTAGGTVKVTLKRQGSRCLLTVSNPGNPILGKDLKNIFKRFYRIDKARSMSHSYGLGLSIAENIVRSHKGKIWAESADGINRFRVLLPIHIFHLINT